MDDKLKAELIRFFNSIGQLGLNAASDLATGDIGLAKAASTTTEQLYDYCDLIDGDIRKIRKMLESQE